MSQAPPPPAIYTTPTHLFFYGYELQIPASCFQNWYPSSFTDQNCPGVRFQTAEQYIMYRKAILMDDHATAQKILNSATPREAGRLGREVNNYDGEKWKANVEEVAETCYYLKFDQVQECREALLDTGDKILAEASPSDRNWGIGFQGDEAEGNQAEWGRNIAGQALMKVRERLRQGAAAGKDCQRLERPS